MAATKKHAITNHQRKVFDFIEGFIKEFGYGPNRQQIADEFGFGIHNAGRYIYTLCRKGWIKSDNSKRPPVLEVI